MKLLRKFSDSPYWSIYLEKKFENTASFLTTLAVNTLAALSEGISFGLILLAFTALNGDIFTELKKLPFLLSLLPSHLSSQQMFLLLIIAAIIFQILRSGLSYLGQKFITKMSIRFQIAMERRIYLQIFSLSFSYINRYKPGDLVEAVQTPSKIHSVLDSVNKLFVCFFNMVALVTLLFLISSSMAGVVLILFTVIYALQKVIFKSLATESSSLTKELADFNHYTFQCLNGLKTIFTFNRQHYMYGQVKKKAESIGEMTGRLFLMQFALGPLNEALGIMTVGICVILAPFFLKGPKEILLPALLTFVTVAYRLATKLQAGIASLGNLSFFFGSFSHLSGFLERKGKQFSREKGNRFFGFKDCIEFRDVSLKYEGNSTPSVSNLSFVLPKGKLLALVGSSGAGKSSIADLCIGLYEPDSGSILIDGVDRSTYDLSSWRDHLGVVSQDAFLLNNTVEDNIRFGFIEATQQQIINAAKDAHAHEFIEKLPFGYKTLLGSHGHQLSGGEKQRVALARALLRQPEILILDEATSHLDSQSEQIIQETLVTFRGKKTLIVIAHRLFSVMNADEILVLDEGRVIERGRHNELIDRPSKYAHFWSLQQKERTDSEKMAGV